MLILLWPSLKVLRYCVVVAESTLIFKILILATLYVHTHTHTHFEYALFIHTVFTAVINIYDNGNTIYVPEYLQYVRPKMSSKGIWFSKGCIPSAASWSRTCNQYGSVLKHWIRDFVSNVQIHRLSRRNYVRTTLF